METESENEKNPGHWLGPQGCEPNQGEKGGRGWEILSGRPQDSSADKSI